MKRICLGMVLLCSLAVVSCCSLGSREYPEAEWKTEEPAAAGINETQLAQAVSDFYRRSTDIHDVIIVKKGRIVFKATGYPYPEKSPHALMSCTKSVVSALIGIAIKEKIIPGIDSPISLWFPELEKYPEHRDLELRHLLTMTVGIRWNETGTYGSGDSYLEMLNSRDPVGYFFSKERIYPPGQVFAYNSGAAVILGKILEKAAGMSLRDYAQSRLFGPIGVNIYSWQTLPDGSCIGGSGLYITAEEMARFGLLIARNGQWGSRQIIPASWISGSVKKLVDTPRGVSGDKGYGMLWWMNSQKGFSARGFGGQYILVYPEEDLVIVTTGGLFLGDHLNPDIILGNQVLRSIGNPYSDPAALRNALSLFSGPLPAISVLPEEDIQYLGKTYRFEEGSVLRISSSPRKGFYRLFWIVNGNTISMDLPKEGSPVSADLGSFGVLPENKAALSLEQVSENTLAFLVRRYGIPYSYRYIVEFNNSSALWKGYVTYMKAPIEAYSGRPEREDPQYEGGYSRASAYGDFLQPWKTFPQGQGPVYSLDWSSDGEMLAASDYDTIRLWNMKTGEAAEVLAGHTGYIWGLSFSPGSGFLASASQDGTVRIWNSKESSLAADINNGWTLCVRWSPGGEFLAAGSHGGGVNIWETTGWKPAGSLSARSRSPVISIGWSPDGRLIAAGRLDGNIDVWDMEKGGHIITLSGYTDKRCDVNGLAWSPDGKILSTTHQDGTIRLWNRETWKIIRSIKAHSGWARGIAWSPRGDLIATTGENGMLCLWLPESGEKYAEHLHSQLPVWSVSWSPDGRGLAAGSGIYNQPHSGFTAVWKER